MKQIQIENGVIRYYGNRVGRVTEGCAVVDPMFQNEALESFLRKQRNIQKIQWQDGIYDRLANSQEDMESAKGLKGTAPALPDPSIWGAGFTWTFPRIFWIQFSAGWTLCVRGMAGKSRGSMELCNDAEGLPVSDFDLRQG